MDLYRKEDSIGNDLTKVRKSFYLLSIFQQIYIFLNTNLININFIQIILYMTYIIVNKLKKYNINCRTESFLYSPLSLNINDY